MALVALHGISEEGFRKKIDIIFLNHPLTMIFLTHHIQSPLSIFHIIDMGVHIQVTDSHLEVTYMNHLLGEWYTFGLHGNSTIEARVEHLLTIGHIDRVARGDIHGNPSRRAFSYLAITYIELELAEGMYPLNR